MAVIREGLSGLEYFRRMIAGDFPPPPMLALLGITLLEADEGRVVFTGTVEENHYNGMGVAHGGYAALRKLWPVENGGMSLGLALLALRLAPDSTDAERTNVEAELSTSFETTAFLDDNVALAWATLATSDRLDTITLAP